MSSILLDTFRLHGCAFSERHVFLASLPLYSLTPSDVSSLSFVMSPLFSPVHQDGYSKDGILLKVFMMDSALEHRMLVRVTWASTNAVAMVQGDMGWGEVGRLCGMCSVSLRAQARGGLSLRQRVRRFSRVHCLSISR